MTDTAAGPRTNLDKYDRAALEPNSLARVLARVKYDGECWIWQGALNNRGYATIQILHSPLYVHRLTYRIVRGQLGEGLVLDHLCRRPACVNPMHTELVTSATNTLRGEGNSSKRFCPSGHEYSDANTRFNTDRKGRTRRYCIECVNARNRAR